MFNEITAAQAEERVAHFHREAEVRRLSPSPRHSFARFLTSVAEFVEPDAVRGDTRGRHVRT